MIRGLTAAGGILALVAAACVARSGAGSAPVGLDPASRSRAAGLFSEHCAICHGSAGEGDGSASTLLYPPARNFALGFFRLVSTTNGVATEADLVETLRHGMPGSAMPSWGWMPDEDLESLASYVLELTRVGLAARLRHPAEGEVATLTDDEIAELVDEWTTPGDAVEIGSPRAPVESTLHEGRLQFVAHCSSCHGLRGRGRAGNPKRNEDGSLTWARDFTAGILKGGASHDALWRRIHAGMPGSAMPQTDLDDQDTAALIAYVQSIIPRDERAQYRQVRTRIDARRVEAPAPLEAADPRWYLAAEVNVALAPLDWSDGSILSASLAALHDGETIAFRLTWCDPTRDDRLLGGSPYPDAAALQVSNADSPPPFGMGSHDHPVNIWRWDAVGWDQVAGALDLIERPRPREVTHDGVVLSPPPPEDVAGAAVSEGPGAVTPLLLDAREVTAQSTREGDEWSIVFRRKVAPENADEVRFVPGEPVQLGWAIWNGSAGDHLAKKSITIWHELVLED